MVQDLWCVLLFVSMILDYVVVLLNSHWQQVIMSTQVRIHKTHGHSVNLESNTHCTFQALKKSLNCNKHHSSFIEAHSPKQQRSTLYIGFQCL